MAAGRGATTHLLLKRLLRHDDVLAARVARRAVAIEHGGTIGKRRGRSEGGGDEGRGGDLDGRLPNLPMSRNERLEK